MPPSHTADRATRVAEVPLQGRADLYRDGRPVAVNVTLCGECFAYVPIGRVEQHARWHRRLNAGC